MAQQLEKVLYGFCERFSEPQSRARVFPSGSDDSLASELTLPLFPRVERREGSIDGAA